MRRRKLQALTGTLFVGGVTLLSCAGGIDEKVGTTEEGIDSTWSFCIENGGSLICAPAQWATYKPMSYEPDGTFLTEQQVVDHYNETLPSHNEPCEMWIVGPSGDWVPSSNGSYPNKKAYTTHHNNRSVHCPGYCCESISVSTVNVQRIPACPPGWSLTTSLAPNWPYCSIAAEKLDDDEDCKTSYPVNVRTGSKLLAEEDALFVESRAA